MANGLRHMLRLIKSLNLLYSCGTRKLQHLQITQYSCWARLNYDTNLRHSTLWASSGLLGCYRNLLYYSVSHLLHCHHTQCQGKSLEPSLQNRCTSSKFLRPPRRLASTSWCHLHSSAKTVWHPTQKTRCCSFRDVLRVKCQQGKKTADCQV